MALGRALAEDVPDDAARGSVAASADWRLRASAGAAVQRRRDPVFAQAVMTTPPLTTRNGVLRFTDPRLRTPDAAPLLIERLTAPNTPALQRAALVDALRLSGGDWSEAVAGQLLVETDPLVRQQLAGALEHAEADVAFAGLTRAVTDPHAAVRAAALRAIGAREDGAVFTSQVLVALGDPDPEARAFAARAAGWLGLADAWTGLVPLLADLDAEVRLKAVAALERLDMALAAALPGLQRLRQDPDPRVARAAERVLGR